MHRIAGGDVFAFAELVRRHTPSVYRASYRMLYDRQEAEDVTQECFARLWQNAPRWCETGNGVPAWLHRVTVNLCFDRRRKAVCTTSDELPEFCDPSPSADRLIEQSQVQYILEECLDALSDTHRASIVLTYYEGHTNKVAADILQMDIKAFESLLFRARKRLSVLLAQGGVRAPDVELLA